MLIKLLEKAAFLINVHCIKPSEQDKARLCNKMAKKLKRKRGETK